MFSPVAISNLFTMGAAAKVDPRQKVPEGGQYVIPDAATRETRARLELSEALEKVQALGFTVRIEGMAIDDDMAGVEFTPDREPDLDEILDASADQIYVAVGTMLVCGAPDMPHLEAVCKANDAKFPAGVATVNAAGKYQKPPGWEAPDHSEIRPSVDLQAITRYLLTCAEQNIAMPIAYDRLYESSKADDTDYGKVPPDNTWQPKAGAPAPDVAPLPVRSLKQREQAAGYAEDNAHGIMSDPDFVPPRGYDGPKG